MATDLSFHHQAFFESAGEHLATMDRLWLELEVENPDPLMLQAILRATHSLKGGAAIVRFDAMAHLAHQVESLLGQICAGSLPLRSEMVDAFLSADDMLKDMLAAHRGGPATDPAAIAAITQRLQELTTAPNSSQADESFGFFAPLPAAEARPAHEYKPATASPNCLRPPAPNRSMTMTRKEDHTAGGYAQEFLTFALGPEEYAIDILKVQEIRGYEQPTTLANTPAFIKGVINLRGIIVPIVDMRIKFSVGPADYTQFTVVIILNVGGRVVGIVVDAVSDVTTLRSDQIRPTPEFAATVNTRYINGLGTLNERMLIVVDIEKLMGSNEMALVDTAKAGE